jgi:hypothetical protein
MHLLKPLSILQPISLHYPRSTTIAQTVETKERAAAPVARLKTHGVGYVVEFYRVAERGFEQDVVWAFLEGSATLLPAKLRRFF